MTPTPRLSKALYGMLHITETTGKPPAIEKWRRPLLVAALGGGQPARPGALSRWRDSFSFTAPTKQGRIATSANKEGSMEAVAFLILVAFILWEERKKRR